MSRPKQILRSVLLAPVALLLLFEEWGWKPLAAGFAALGRLPVWRRLESQIAGLSPWAALLAFGIPVLALVPVKLMALYLIGQGHIALGVALVLLAKLAGTALAARLFQLTQPALMRLKWFARIYTPFKRWKDRMLRQVRASKPWRAGRKLKRRAIAAGLRLKATFRAVISGWRT